MFSGDASVFAEATPDKCVAPTVLRQRDEGGDVRLSIIAGVVVILGTSMAAFAAEAEQGAASDAAAVAVPAENAENEAAPAAPAEDAGNATAAAPAPAGGPANAAAPAEAAPAEAAPAAPKRLVSAQEVAEAIRKGVDFMKSRQSDNGSWPYHSPDHMQGMAALAALALSESGVPEGDPSITKAMNYVLSLPIAGTYDAGCAAMAIVSIDPGKYIKELAETRDYLMHTQGLNGMWVYSAEQADRGGGDNSNTQFAMLGLNAALSVGLPVSPDTLKMSLAHFVNTQNSDGGWGYRPGDKSYGSMTAVGVSALAILGANLFVETEVCGEYKQNPELAAGFAWLERNYTIDENPEKGETWLYYYLYALERVGVLTGQKYIGNHDWYLEGARKIVDTQNADGSWTSGSEHMPNTCFALLFLAKGNVPVLINKLAYEGDWNIDVHDAQNLTHFISANFGQQVGWQTVTMEDSLETLLSAPILYLTGHDFPKFSDADIDKLRSYFENGGFMLVDDCCGRAGFEAGFKAFAQKIFPDYPMTRIDKAHPFYRLMFSVKDTQRPLYGIDAGCRTAIVYSPKDLSCAWEKGDLTKDLDAFQLGANIAAYVTGKEKLLPKLEQYKELVQAPKTVTAAPTAFTFAQAMYAGAWDPHPMSGPKLISFLNDKAGIYVSSKVVTLPLTDPNLANYPFLYMTGRARFKLSDEEKKGLSEYLKRGGFVFADASAGKAEFDESFREMMAQVLPQSPLAPIPADSPIYNIAFDTTHVRYTASVRETSPNLDTLTLYGAKVDDRITVVYSPYDIGCALEQYPSYGSKGLVTEDAFKAAANIVLYALTY